MPSTISNQSNPAERLLDSANALFDYEGIRAVGIDRLIEHAGVARASLYQHFGSKDGLVVGYLERADRTDRANYARATQGLAPLDRIRAVFTLATAGARRRHYRGCLYINALTEFPDHDHPIRRVVIEHREWLLDELTRALEQAGMADPRPLAARIQLLYDGALIGTKANRDTESIERAALMVEELIVGQPRADTP